MKRYNLKLYYTNQLYKTIYRKKGKIKAIIVLLFYSEIVKFINNNIYFLQHKYYDKLIFFVTNNISTIETYRNITYFVVDVSNIFFKFPYGFNKSKYKSIYKRRGEWNYQHMCRFFFRDIFFHPFLFDVDLFMRLDSESILNTSVNLFNYMKRDIVYMHNRIFNDADFVVLKLKEFTESLIKLLNIKIRDKYNYNRAFLKTVLSYYNNFEICKMSFFRSKEMIQFVNLVDYSYGQFIYRWGDAPLRFISLSLYAKRNAKISIPKNIKYCHKDCNF